MCSAWAESKLASSAAQAKKISLKVKFGRNEERGMTRMPPVHMPLHTHAHTHTHNRIRKRIRIRIRIRIRNSHWPSLHALRKLNSLGEIYAPSRLLPRKETAMDGLDATGAAAADGGNCGVEAGRRPGHSSISALCVVAFRTQRNATCNKATATATGN